MVRWSFFREMTAGSEGWKTGRMEELSEWDLYRTRYLESLSHSLFTHLISLDRIKRITRISRIKPYELGKPPGKLRR